MQAQRLHEAAAAGAGAQRHHRGEQVVDHRAQTQLGALGADGNASHPGGVLAQAVDEAQQRVREREPGLVWRDLRAGGLVLQRRRRVRRDADVRAPGVRRDEQAALAARHDAQPDLCPGIR